MTFRTSAMWLRSGKRPPCTESNSAHTSEQRPDGREQEWSAFEVLPLNGVPGQPCTKVCNISDFSLLQSRLKTPCEMSMSSFWRRATSVFARAVLVVLVASASLWASDAHRRTSIRPGGQSSPPHNTVRQIKILGSKESVEIEIETSDPITPQTQLLTGPDRLVLDFPNAVPGNDLRSQSIYVGEVKDIRAGLFRPVPPITRLVVDLDGPESYQVFPAGRTVMIKMTTGSRTGAPVAVDKWREPAVASLTPVSETQQTVPDDPPKPSLNVEFANGLLTIKADRVSLGEILRAVHDRTGADVSPVPGGDQEKVVSYLGPALAQDVLARLLNGSKFNYLILNAAGDPKKLDRVILTPRAEAGATPLAPLPSGDPSPEPAMAAPVSEPQYPPPVPEINSQPEPQ